MRDAVICEPLRTPVGGFGGSLRDVPAVDLASTVIRALMQRTGLAPDAVDEVVLGHCYPTMDAPAIGRVAALDAGPPVTATGIQIDRRWRSRLPDGLSSVVTGGCRAPPPASRSTGGAGPACRRCCTRRCRCRRASRTSSSPAAPSR